MNYSDEIKALAAEYKDLNSNLGYDAAIRLAKEIASRHGRDTGWSSHDFEEACDGREVLQ